jgi:serine protease
MKRLLLLICCLAGLQLSAQPHRPGEFLVLLKPEVSVESWLRQWPELRLRRQLSQDMNLHWLALASPNGSDQARLEQLKGMPEVLLAQFNHPVERRQAEATLPNDPSFSGQWALNNTGQNGGLPDADIDAPEAWDLTTGGPVATGERPVIAIVDEGSDSLHQDLLFWSNPREIRGNGIDDDGNSRVDDWQGWNFYDGSSILPSTEHGSHVAGIAGARGDNQSGIAGVNWDVQLLNIAASSVNEALVVEAYAYVIEMRKRFDESGGSDGAFIVATNSSFGVNNGTPGNFPIWCAMYDSLGKLGILNAVSTTNQFIDVDQLGDIPSTCPSPYTLVTTSTNRRDELHTAGYGQSSVDLGAPGVDILSSIPNDRYRQLSGTSMAAPHVAGAISLMFAVADADFMSTYFNYPDSLALSLKSRLLSATDALPSLQDSTLSGGRLNLYQSLLALQAYADSLPDCAPPYALQQGLVTDSSMELGWKANPQAQANLIRYRPLGQTSWQQAFSPVSSLSLPNLQACQRYEIQAASLCQADTGAWGRKWIFESEGCCRGPQEVGVRAVTANRAVLFWEPVYGAQEYEVFYSRFFGGGFSSLMVQDTFAQLLQLDSCEIYVAGVIPSCGSSPDTSELTAFKTMGCGSCVEGNYCLARATQPEDDWIKRFQLGAIDNPSQNDNGYGDYTGPAYALLQAGQTYSFRAEPEFASTPFSQMWRIWIDYNRDEDFDDPGELAFDLGQAIDTAVVGQIRVPEDAISGPTRLRVSMRFLFSPEPCGNYMFGEVEDYCVEIDGVNSVEKIAAKSLLRMFPNPTSSQLQVESDFRITFWQLVNELGQRVKSGNAFSSQLQLDLSELPAGLYLLRVAGKDRQAWGKVVRRSD